MTQILVVDDDSRIQNMLRRYLEGEGYIVQIASNLKQSYLMLKQYQIDIILLDLRLGREDGLAMLREIRASDQHIGVIILSAKTDPVDKVVGLELGADDYVTKPFHLRELQARINTVIRRLETNEHQSTKSSEGKLVFGPWQFDISRRQLLDIDGNECRLTTSEFNLLEAFILNEQKVLSRDQLMDLTSGRKYEPYDRTIDTQVRRLRKKIETSLSDPKFIKTVRGIGYVFAEKTTKKT